MVNLVSINLLPFFFLFIKSFSFLLTFISALQICLISKGLTRIEFLLFKKSVTPPTFVEITVVPTDNASAIDNPNPSKYLLGETKN